MISTNSYEEEVNSYWDLIKNLKSEVKLRLITLLSQSLSRSMDKAHSPNDEFINKIYGACDDDHSTEEILRDINEHKTCKTPISFD
ncbi:MAG: hypothetical protein HDR88_02325 [Bacteroides sp.]|nr:hypothetical protein [Bacteroides sp.]